MDYCIPEPPPIREYVPSLDFWLDIPYHHVATPYWEFEPDFILQQWRDTAHRLVETNDSRSQEIVKLNQIAIRFARASNRCVPLVGRDEFCP